VTPFWGRRRGSVRVADIDPAAHYTGYWLQKEVRMADHKHSSCIARLLSIVAVLVLGESVSLAESPPANSETVGLVCQPASETEIHAPGDPHWIGHEMQQLKQVLGKEEMLLGKPSKNRVLVYSRRGADCLDAYVIDSCDMVINYYCRPIPVAPMEWDRQSPTPESR
jgi:hypothetical protein